MTTYEIISTILNIILIIISIIGWPHPCIKWTVILDTKNYKKIDNINTFSEYFQSFLNKRQESIKYLINRVDRVGKRVVESEYVGFGDKDTELLIRFFGESAGTHINRSGIDDWTDFCNFYENLTKNGKIKFNEVLKSTK